MTEKSTTKINMFDIDNYPKILSDTTIVALIGADTNGTITYFNKGAENMLGYSADEIVNKQTPVIFHDLNEIKAMGELLSSGNYTPKGFDVFVKISEAKGYHETQWTYIKKDKSRITVRLRISQVFNDNNELIGLLGIANDVTDLAETKERNHAIQFTFDNTTEGIYWIDEDGNISIANKAAENLLGYTKDELVNMNVAEIDPNFNFDKWKENWNNFDNGKSKKIETLQIRKDGTEFPVEINMNLFTFNNKKYICAFTRNLQFRQELEKKLRENSEKFKLIAKELPIILFMIDKDGIFTLSEGRKLSVIGLKPGQVVGMNVFDVYKDNEPIKAAIRKTLNGETSGWFAEVNGHYFESATSPIFNNNNEVESLIGLSLDMTDKQKLEKKFENVINSAPFGIHLYKIIDGELIFSGYNPAADKILKFDHNIIMGKEITEAFPMHKKTDIPKIYIDVANNGTSWNTESVDYQDEKINSAFEVHAFQTEPGAMAAFFNDITDKKIAEKEKLNFIEELEAKNSELERFTYTVSHDLRSPLITIKGFLGILRNDLENKNLDRTDSFIKRIENAARTMQDLLDDLLELSRIGRIINPSTDIDTLEVIKNVINMLDAQIKSKNIHIELSDSFPYIYADKQRLHEVFQNLIENAAKFIGDNNPAPKIEIGYSDKTQYIEFFVKDNGIGIEKRYHEKVFSLFDKLDKNTEGTGVGLALVKRIIDFHGGDIRIESDGNNTGSTFYFTIPAKTEEN